jgi:chitosanase
MVTDLQKKTAQAIVQIFETSKVAGDYGRVTLLAGDTGHLTYGKAQTTLASGNLHLLIAEYCRTPGAVFAGPLSAFLPQLDMRDFSLDHNSTLRGLLRDAGEDSVMQAVQDSFFDRVFWQPAMTQMSVIGGTEALTAATVYYSTVHGSWRLMRDRTNKRHGKPADLGEQAWIAAYIATRRDWLANHSNTLLHKTVYRIYALQALVDDASWSLPLPLTVRGIRIDEAALANDTRVSASDPDERVLKLTRPMMRGSDVRALQKALKAKKVAVKIDGIFGSDTERAVVQFQVEARLTVDGIAGPATWGALET